jgi:hypothetical protein
MKYVLTWWERPGGSYADSSQDSSKIHWQVLSFDCGRGEDRRIARSRGIARRGQGYPMRSKARGWRRRTKREHTCVKGIIAELRGSTDE